MLTKAKQGGNIDPSLLPVGHTEIATPTGLQSDSYSCGFWSTFFAWATLLDFNPHEAAAMNLGISDLKAIFAVIWIAYRTRPGGVPTSFVEAIFVPLGANVDWAAVGATVSGGSVPSDIFPL